MTFWIFIFIVKIAFFVKLIKKSPTEGLWDSLWSTFSQNFTTFFHFCACFRKQFLVLKTLYFTGLFSPKKEESIFLISCNFVFLKKYFLSKTVPQRGLGPPQGFKSTLKGTAKASANTLGQKTAPTGALLFLDAQALKIDTFLNINFCSLAKKCPDRVPLQVPLHFWTHRAWNSHFLRDFEDERASFQLAFLRHQI